MRILFLLCVTAWMCVAQMTPGGGGGGSTQAATISPPPVQPGTVQLGQTVAVTGVTSMNGSVSVSGDLAGSTPGQELPAGPVNLSLADAVSRGLRYNLGAVSADLSTREARAGRLQYLSALLPNIWINASQTVTQVNLAAYGFQFKVPAGLNFSIPSVVGPYTYSSVSGNLSQSIWDPVARRNYKQGQLSEQSTQLSARDTRELVVVAVAGTYLQAVAQQARLESQSAQVATAEAVYKQAVARKAAGTNAKIDVSRSFVEFQTEQQRLIALRADLQKQKLALARIIGLPMNHELNLVDRMRVDSGTAAVQSDDLLTRALKNRLDVRAAEAAVSAAEAALSAAHAERLPSITLSGDYGAIGPNPTNAHGVFAITGAVNVPVWNGGRVRADILEAETALARRRATLADLRSRVEQEVRQAEIDSVAAKEQLAVARSNRDYANEVLAEARDRFEAGVATTVEVVQAQEQLSNAEESVVSSLFAYELAQLSAGRASGNAESAIQSLISGDHR